MYLDTLPCYYQLSSPHPMYLELIERLRICSAALPGAIIAVNPQHADIRCTSLLCTLIGMQAACAALCQLTWANPIACQ